MARATTGAVADQTNGWVETDEGAPTERANGRWRLDGTFEYYRAKRGMPRGLRNLCRALAVLAGVYLLIALTAFALQNRLIYHPNRNAPTPANQALATGEDVTLHTADGLALGAWFATPPSHIARRDQVMLYAGGNAGNRESRASLVFFLNERGFDVLSFDYRGFGGNPGTPSEAGLALDAQAAAAELERRGFAQHQIIYFGESLGAAVMARLATTNPPGALILRSPFTSLDAVAGWHLPFLPTRLLLRDHYPVAELMPRITSPVLVLYGMSDRTVPRQQSIAVAQASPTLMRAVPFLGVGHNDSMWWGMRIADHIVAVGNSLR